MTASRVSIRARSPSWRFLSGASEAAGRARDERVGRIVRPAVAYIPMRRACRCGAVSGFFCEVRWWGLGLPVAAVVVYGATRLIRASRELQAARAELATGQERLRVSRDVDDLASQSLSAVALKGDLALRLLPDDPAAARTEMESLTATARDALHEVQAATRGAHVATLHAEAGGAMRLLAAAGIDTHVNVDVSVPGPAADVLAWALREGVTNVLRHSEARTCSITAARSDGSLRLEIVNDGVRTPSGPKSGLTKLTELAQGLSGSVTAGPTRDGGFRLLVELPEEAT
jgi:two-component system, NarL family, sensor histidine kinase DesK